MVFGVIRERRRLDTRDSPKDLLEMLLAARDEETGEGMTDQQQDATGIKARPRPDRCSGSGGQCRQEGGAG